MSFIKVGMESILTCVNMRESRSARAACYITHGLFLHTRVSPVQQQWLN